jgi:hemoglobin
MAKERCEGTNGRFRTAVLEHVDFGTPVAMQNSNATTEEERHPLREDPRWTWAGDDEARG